MGDLIPQESRACLDLPLVNYTFLTLCTSVLSTNVYAGPKHPFLRGFSNTWERRFSPCRSELPKPEWWRILSQPV
jgi:hypothetical protein